MEHIPLDVALPEVPKFVRGDEKADDGDWLVQTIPSEPNSLNPLRDNDASVSSFFGLANDSLATRSWDDLSIWEPRLALAWKKELICLAYVKDGKAQGLANDIGNQWGKELRDKLQIKKIAADSADVLRIEIGDVNNDYREQLQKDFGGRLEMQWWFYLDYQGQEFMDGSPITPQAIEKRLQDTVKNAPGFTGRVVPGYAFEDKVILCVLGDEKARDTAEQALKALAESPDNKCKVVDEKSASGKREDKCYRYEIVEDYIAQEKPVFTFYLRKDVKWHDGEPFSGKDVIFTFNTMRNQKIECGHIRNYYNDCETAELVDNNPYIVRFSWIRPYFDAFTFSSGINILPEHIYHFNDPKEFNEGGPQNQGSWSVPARTSSKKWEKGQQFVFCVRNTDDYYGRKPHFKRQLYRLVKDPTAETQLFEAGETDFHTLLPSEMKTREKDPEVQQTL